jgi:hypothetical protein
MPQNFVGDIFGLTSVYDRQVLNIEQNNFINWPESATYGYYGGGFNGSVYINTITRLDFSNETVSDPGKNLPTARRELATTSSNSYGYFGGGNILGPSYICTISRLDFSNETVSDPGQDFPLRIGAHAGASSSFYGYFGGGFSPPFICTITRLDFSNETVSQPGKNLPTARRYLAAVSSNSYGYFGGAALISTITRLDFSNETVSDPGKNLPTARYGSATVSTNSYGYFGGGITLGPSFTCTISRLDFSNETLSDPGKNLPTSRSDLAGTLSNSYGHFGGGISGVVYINTITRLDFSNETVSDPGKNLPTQRNELAATSGGQSVFRTPTISSGYFAGGSQSPSAYRSSILKMDFSTEVISENPARNFISARRLSAAAANNFYGYFAGGSIAPPTSYFSTVVKLDFSNDTVNENPTRNLPTSVLSGMEGSYGLSSNSYGYFGGGINGITRTSQISRLDFSTDILSNSSLINLPEGRSYGATVTSASYGYFGGGTKPPFVVYISNITRLDFSNETVIDPTNSFSIIKGFVGSSSNNSYGYFAGGLSVPPPGNQLSSITRLDFSSDVISDSPSRNLPAATSSGSGTSNNLYGYFSGGVTPTPSIISTIVRIDFSTETIGLPGKHLPTALQYMTGISGSSAFTDSSIAAVGGGGGGSYSIVSGNKSPVHGSGGGTYVLSGWTGLVNFSVDDGFATVPLAFSTWTINSTAYSTAYVGSNTYITFGSGSTVYSGISASNPSLNKFNLGASDNSYQRVQYFSNTTGGQGYTRIRYEGNGSTSGTVGSPGIVYECTFFDPNLFGGKNVVEILVGNHNRTTGQFGVANTSTYYASGTIASSTSYVFEGNSTGTSWTIWTGYSVSGTDY